MSDTEVLVKLRDLHGELAVINDNLRSVEQVDEATIDELGQLVSDTVGLMDRTHDIAGVPPETSDKYDLLDRVMKFKSDHPRVHRMLSQVSDVLAMLGL